MLDTERCSDPYMGCQKVGSVITCLLARSQHPLCIRTLPQQMTDVLLSACCSSVLLPCPFSGSGHFFCCCLGEQCLALFSSHALSWSLSILNFYDELSIWRQSVQPCHLQSFFTIYWKCKNLDFSSCSFYSTTKMLHLPGCLLI